jgi:arylsulfatase A-like enzyme
MLWVSDGSSQAAERQSLPNIVVFLTDDQGPKDCIPFGEGEFHTPNMQRLAEEGLCFDRAFVGSPTCGPSRAALLTGFMPARNGAELTHSKPRQEIKKWPAYFQQLGYEVVAFGKVAHYNQAADYGFDFWAHDAFHDDAGIPAAVEYLKKRNGAGGKPLCILAGSNWPHVPWPDEAPDYDPATIPLPAGSVDTPATRLWRTFYAAAVAKADKDLGLIYEAARATLGTNTLFLFSSDNGAQWPFGKWNLYDMGVRVPLIVSWPRIIESGKRTDAMVSWVDVLPTLLEAAGGRVPSGLDGHSFLSVLRGKSKTHRNRIFTTHSGDGDGGFNTYPMRSVRSERWKYVWNLHPEFAFVTHIDMPVPLGQRAYFSTWESAAKSNPQAAAIVERYHKRPSEELYDLQNDPDEQHNLADDPRQASRLKKMRVELEDWMRSQGDKRTVYGKPRLLSDPNSYGPGATVARKSEGAGASTRARGRTAGSVGGMPSAPALLPGSYLGWKTQCLSNDLLQLHVVPQVGGRVVQFKMGSKEFFWTNPDLAGREPTRTGLGVDDSWLNYGGDKLWPAPQGWNGPDQWPGPPDAVLDGQPYAFEVLPTKPGEAAIRMTGGKDPLTGIQFSRVIRLAGDSTCVDIEATMKNIDNRPRRWGIWAHTQLDARARTGGGYNALMKAYTPYNPSSSFKRGYEVIFGEQDNPSFSRDEARGLITVKYLYQVGKIGVDSPAGWVATVDGSSGDVFVQRFVYQPDKEYPEGSSVEFWHNGAGRIHAYNRDIEMPEDPSKNPYVFESEVLSPFATLQPGETYTWKYQWYAANVGGDFPVLDVQPGGVTASLLKAKNNGNQLRLDGRFGVFFSGAVDVVYLGKRNRELGRMSLLGSVTPLRQVVVDHAVRPSEGTTSIALDVVAAGDGRSYRLSSVQLDSR